jgi:hypothetical protein
MKNFARASTSMIFPDTGFHLNVSQHEVVIRIGYARFRKMILNTFEKG